MKFLAGDQIAEAIASEACILGIIEGIWCIGNNCHESSLPRLKKMCSGYKY